MEPDFVYEKLAEYYGKKKWWQANRDFEPRELEIAVGAILTQNTNWGNVEKALNSMVKEGITDLESILNTETERLEEIIKPSGFYRQKSRRLKVLAKYISAFRNFEDFLKRAKRQELLNIRGIGPETADSILLYVCGRTHFVVDSYTRRILKRLGMTDGKTKYQEIKSLFEDALPSDPEIYKKCHAVMVEHAKRHCRKRPDCSECPLSGICARRNP